jgi:glucose-6-phosphate 1-epimerase
MISNGTYKDFPALLVQTANSSAAISLFGAQILSFKPSSQPERLWLSPKALALPNPIRGGIPICWPWFAKQGQSSDAPQHGLARTAMWALKSHAIDLKGTAILNLEPKNRLHPDLDVTLEISLNHWLQMRLTTRNVSQNAFTLSQAFHSYFEVANVDQVAIKGLEGLTYLDKLKDFAPVKQDQPFTRTLAPFDRIYQKAKGFYSIHDPITQNTIEVSSQASQTAIVWNPGSIDGFGMRDVGSSVTQFICLEVANAAQDTPVLAPGTSFTLTMLIK